MKKIFFVTTTRADFGLLRPFIDVVKSDSQFEVRLIVSGTHLLKNYGETINEIITSGINADYIIEIFDEQIDKHTTSFYMGSTLMSFDKFFDSNTPDYVVILGDRFEMLAIAIAAYNKKIPIIHLYGGETTEGATDEAYRHAITKLSNLHFTSTEEYKRRVIQLGENPSTVHNIGSIGVENVLKCNFYSREEVSNLLNMDLTRPFSVVTFHPETLNSEFSLNHLKITIETH